MSGAWAFSLPSAASAAPTARPPVGAASAKRPDWRPASAARSSRAPVEGGVVPACLALAGITLARRGARRRQRRGRAPGGSALARQARGGEADYYGTLGVATQASERDIRSAFRKLARQYHPDVNKEHASPPVLHHWPDAMSCGAGDVDPANWMAEFSHVPVPNLVMPGAHDSGAQDLNGMSTAPDWKAARGLLPLACCVAKPWSEAQGCGAAAQLLAGCRYFDLRIGIDDAAEEGTAESYRLCHGYFSKGTLEDFLEDVRGFLDEHPTEAVFLEAKTVTSFTDSVSMEQHHGLIAHVEELLGGKGAFVNKKNMMRPLGELLSEGKQVFMVYRPGGWGHPGESPVDKHRDTMLPGYLMRSMWPNVCDPTSLCDRLGQEIEEQSAPNHDKFLVLQCVMTPGAGEILKGLFGCGFFDRSLFALARRAEPDIQELLESVPESSLAHGAVIMLDWLEEQPDLIQWVLHRNYACHVPA